MIIVFKNTGNILYYRNFYEIVLVLINKYIMNKKLSILNVLLKKRDLFIDLMRKLKFSLEVSFLFDFSFFCRFIIFINF